jgi:hypothetical protein
MREFVIWMRRELGPARSRAVVEGMPADFRSGLDPDADAFGLLASAWYSGEFTASFLESCVRGMGRAEMQRFAHAGSVAALNVTLRGVHRALLRMVMSPDLHRRFAQRLWDGHFDGGRVVVTPAGGRCVEVAYWDWPAHHRVLCEMCTASDLVIYGAMGLADVTSVTTACVSEGDARCAHLVRWSD